MVLRSPLSNPVAKPGVSLTHAAAAALRAGNMMTARQMLQDRLLQDPADANALELLAEIAASQGSVEEATILLRRAVAADGSPERRLALIQHLQRHANPALALAETEQLPAAVRKDFEVKGIEAAIRGVLGHHDQQIRLYQEMAREKPEATGLWVSLGNALKTVGRTAEAVKALQRAVRSVPSYGEAWWTLANFKSFKFTQRDINQMREALRLPLDDADELHIQFALGKAYEDRGDYEQSYRHYAAGNAIRSAQFDPDEVGTTAYVNEWIAKITPEFFERNRNSGHPAEGPIFVVGMHRAGSTLIEQILASHPLVEGTAELGVMTSIRERLSRRTGQSQVEATLALEPAEIRAIGEEYLDRTQPFRLTDRPYFVDKMPGNWQNLALIRTALPNARIIDARRGPMACGFSNFKQNYAHGLGFSYDQRTIGQFYLDYWRLMRRFDELQPGVVCRMLNEKLIEQPEAEVRRMLDHLGLPFDPACLEHHKTERAVRTPSSEQVRKPINREGVDYWRHYEPWLGALKGSLGPALDQWQD